MRDLREFLAALRAEKELVEIDVEADPFLEIPEIHRRVIEAEGPALLFNHPKGSAYPVVTNLFGTRKRIDLAFGARPLDFVKTAVRAATELMPPTPSKLWGFRSFFAQALRVGTVRSARAPVLDEVERDDRVDLRRLPALTLWPEDGGAFLTLPLVYTEHPERHESNLGM